MCYSELEAYLKIKVEELETCVIVFTQVCKHQGQSRTNEEKGRILNAKYGFGEIKDPHQPLYHIEKNILFFTK